MYRNALSYLQSNWLNSPDRKPLVIRGARQVGKTWLVRHFASLADKKLIEINFEKAPGRASLFEGNDVTQILLNLSTIMNESLDPSNCLLFLDEIQEAPEIFAKLRWFYEDLPQLCIIAAGSLLEFILEDHTFSMPVGRISYLHLEPLSFEEFLSAGDKTGLLTYIQNYQLTQEIPSDIHQTLCALFKEYMTIGGMPAAVSSWMSEKSLQTISQIHHELLWTYRDDFAKYSTRIDRHKIDEILNAIPKQLGQKFVYQKANSSMQSATIRNILSLLEKARLCHPVLSVGANGLPLAAGIKEKPFKEIFLDIGLSNALLGAYFRSPEPLEKVVWSYDGGLAEQIVGQILRTTFPFYIQPCLYYWHREDPGSNAEIDYLIDDGEKIIPLEVKAGATGSLKSLHLFMNLKNLKQAIRIHASAPTITHIQNYTLLSIPFYLTSQIHRLCRDLSNQKLGVGGISPYLND